MDSSYRLNTKAVKSWAILVIVFLTILIGIGFSLDSPNTILIQRNALSDGYPDKDTAVPDVGLISNGITLQERGAATFFAAAGTVFFGLIARGAYGVMKYACNPAALAAICAFDPPGAAACIGAFMIGCTAAAISAGLAADGAGKGWQWWKGSGLAERDYEVSHYSTLLNNTFYGGVVHTGELFDELSEILGETLPYLNYLSVLYDNSTGIVKRDSGAQFVSWSSNYTGWHVTTLVPTYQLADSAKAYMNSFTNMTYLMKRDNYEWASFNTYGLNTDIAQVIPDNLQVDADDVYDDLGNYVTTNFDGCSQDQCYSVQNKVCFAAGQSSTPGVNSDIVGEIYFGSYGGVDNECDSI